MARPDSGLRHFCSAVTHAAPFEMLVLLCILVLPRPPTAADKLRDQLLQRPARPQAILAAASALSLHPPDQVNSSVPMVVVSANLIVLSQLIAFRL